MVGREINERIEEHRRTSAALSGHDDAQLATRPSATSIGGSSTTLDIEGTPVFVKRVALTDRELESDASTGNLGLPTRCHYGVGGPGFSAWRELAATTTTSQWVLAGHTEQFPLLHHWRILPGAPAPSSDLTRRRGSVSRPKYSRSADQASQTAIRTTTLRSSRSTR